MARSKKKRGKPSDIVFEPVCRREAYDLWGTACRAALIFLVVYGTIGGFVSAYGIEYHKGICAGVLLCTAAVLAAAYGTGKRWLMNTAALAVFGVYAAVAFASYWVINSGYYVILNTVYEAARNYLGVAEGLEYAVLVEDGYRTVTFFLSFVGVVGVILMNFRVHRRVSLIRTVLISLPFYLVPLFFGKTPEAVYTVMLFAGYLTIGMLQADGVKGAVAGRIRYLLPAALLFCALCVQGMNLLFSQSAYSRLVGKNPYKERAENGAVNFVRFGVMALFKDSGRGAGMSGGRLSWGYGPMPDYETDLIVQFAPYSYETVYLKAFTGKDYDGTKWTSAREEADDVKLSGTAALRREAYLADETSQGRGVMVVENVGADERYEYRPYYADEAHAEQSSVSYVYYPAVGAEPFPAGGPSAGKEDAQAFLSVPDRCRAAVEQVCLEEGFSGEPEEIAAQVVAYFRENFRYTLRPGYRFGSADYISHFLLDSRKGYCMHFASAATMLLRGMGIPARYVEGYAFSYGEMINGAELVEDEAYGEYYSGYAPLGETGVVRMEIPDADAHAWVEIYVQDKGWVVVDPTPASSEQDDTSFWDAFGSWGENGGFAGPGGDGLGPYLRVVFNGASAVLIAGAALLLAVLLIRCLVRVCRDASLPERERVQAAYRRWARRAGRRCPEFNRLRTIREQVEWAEQNRKKAHDEELICRLYEAFYAPGEPDAAYGALRRRIRKLAVPREGGKDGSV